MENIRYLVEDCPVLAVGAIKHDLWRCRRREAEIKGAFSISNGGRDLLYDYWIEYSDGDSFLVVSTGLDQLPQRVLLAEVELKFGARSYFVCCCGVRANNLYLPAGKDQFRCRRCYRLRYALSNINKTSKQGMFLYRANRTTKLINQRAGMDRIIYKNCFTKRFERFLRLCGRVGLDSVITNARESMKVIQS